MQGSELAISKLQKSYLIGRKLQDSLGGVACHAYFEFTGKGIDVEKLKRAWYETLFNHVMTKSYIDSDGVVRPIDKLPKSFYSFEITNSEEWNKKLLECRKIVSARKMVLHKGQGMGMFVFKGSSDDHVICYDADLSVCDVNGIQEFLNELADRYAGIDNKAEYFFPNRTESSRHVEQIDAPMLTVPFGKNAKNLSGCEYSSYDYFMDEGKVKKLEQDYANHNSDLFSGILADLIEARNPEDFSEEYKINIPYFMASQRNEDFVRDNTKILWVSGKKDKNLASHLMKEIQAGLEKEDVEYHINGGIVPIVYSFNQNGVFLRDTFINNLGNLTYMISQTPNVCVDVQLFKMINGLLISWVFPKEMQGTEYILRWFKTFTGKLERKGNTYGRD